MDSNTIVFKNNKHKQFTNSRYYRACILTNTYNQKCAWTCLRYLDMLKTALWFLTCSVAAFVFQRKSFSIVALFLCLWLAQCPWCQDVLYIGQGHNRLPHNTSSTQLPLGIRGISIYSMFIIFRMIALCRIYHLPILCWLDSFIQQNNH